MSRIVRAFFLVLVFALGACSGPNKMALDVRWTGTAYDTVKIPSTPGALRARAAYDDKHEPQVEQIKAQTILTGVRELEREGYDRVAWSGPYPATLTVTTKTSYGVVTYRRVYRGFDFIVRGWKPGEPALPSALPIKPVMDDLKRKAEQSLLPEGQPEPDQAFLPEATSEQDCQVPGQKARFIWPMDGKVILKWHELVNGKPSNGIVIQAEKDAVVRAADAGYVDLMFVGGSAVSMVHPGGYNALYACVREALVKQGDSVVVGQPIAKVGKCSDTPEGSLAFFVRLKGKHVDPMSLLPPE